ncbi:hypothetical protein C7212DRAFT_274183 [Tuber magnatum]|uniref:DUF572-domain-containing protein n=1 Tax=Tuber magnatum TaxID=42249 RepID=A0A317T3L8_9PEZI|nr:hypothetical protein C7212DRAFT_274183 [Tuber magnatum]
MQGFNMGRYVPPDQEGIYTGNQLHKKKPPGIHGNTQTVRFEMPFGIFCLTCDGHIAQGVRFNAEKKKIGKYHTTPIYSFRMRHVSCSGWIEVQTDPKNTRYVVTEGGKKKGGDEEEGEGAAGAVVGEIRIRDPNMPDDPFAAVEKKVADKAGVKKSTERIEELRGLSDRQWLDPYEHSRKMRRVFREKRKELQAKDAASEAIRDRAGLHIELLDEIPEDKIRAQLVEFGPDHGDKVEEARTKPLFADAAAAAQDSAKKSAKKDAAGKTRAQLAAEAAREKLQSEIRRNTRTRVDPFLSLDRPRIGLEFKLLKRKHMEVGPELEPQPDTRGGEQPGEPPKRATADGIGHIQPGVSLGLGAYESDGD